MDDAFRPDPVLDTLFATVQVEQRVLQRRYSAIVALRGAARSLRDEGLFPAVSIDGDKLVLSVAVPGLGGVEAPCEVKVAPGFVAPDISAFGSLGEALAAVHKAINAPAPDAALEDGPDDRWIDGLTFEAAMAQAAIDRPAMVAEQKSGPVSGDDPASAAPVSAGQVGEPVAEASPPPSASDTVSGGGGARSAPAEPYLYSEADDDLILAEIRAAFERGEPKIAGIRAAAGRLGRSVKAIDLRSNKKLAERVQALRDAAPPVPPKAEAEAPPVASPAFEAPAPEAPAPEAPAPVARAVVQARPVPAADPAPEAKDLGVVDHDLLHHLESLPRKLGKVAWFRPDDIALMEAHCARRKIAEIALDMRVDAKLLSARIDLLTGLHENDRGLKVARWPRTDVLAVLKLQGA